MRNNNSRDEKTKMLKRVNEGKKNHIGDLKALLLKRITQENLSWE